MHRSPLPSVVASLLLLAGCAPDSDGDGLSDSEEGNLGTDPSNPDTDGDALLDGDEVSAGTDPLQPDTDGDGYRDGDEVAEGSDPLDDTSWIYAGGWPYNPDKDAIADPGLDGVVDVGDVVGRLRGVDQFGDSVDLYDFAALGRPILLDLSAEWCGPCQNVSSWLAGGDDPNGLEASYGDVRAAIASGEVLWITIMEQDRFGNTADAAAVERWDTDYPNVRIPVLADPVNSGMLEHLGQVAYPNFHALRSDMTLAYRNTPGGTSLDLGALDSVADLAGL